jgi:hypothetical protein
VWGVLKVYWYAFLKGIREAYGGRFPLANMDGTTMTYTLPAVKVCDHIIQSTFQSYVQSMFSVKVSRYTDPTYCPP